MLWTFWNSDTWANVFHIGSHQMRLSQFSGVYLKRKGKKREKMCETSLSLEIPVKFYKLHFRSFNALRTELLALNVHPTVAQSICWNWASLPPTPIILQNLFYHFTEPFCINSGLSSLGCFNFNISNWISSKLRPNVVLELASVFPIGFEMPSVCVYSEDYIMN